MKKILLFAAAALVFGQTLTSCSSCSGDKQQDKKEQIDPAKVFTKADTTRVLELVEQFNLNMKEGNLKGALDMLYFLNGDSIKEVEPINKQRQAVALALLARCANYELDRIIFRDNIDNEVKIDITLFEKKEGDPRPNQTSFYFRPIRRDGQWYLTTKDNITDTRSDLRNRKEKEEE